MSERSNLVLSTIKSLNIIELLNSEHEMSISELSQKLGLDKSTVYRLISTLKFKGYVEQNPNTLKYKNSLKLFEIGNNTVKKLELRSEALFFLKELNIKTGETVNLAILDKFDIVYIDKIESPETIRIGLSVGKRVPAYCCALGKMLLSFLSEMELNKLVHENTLERYTKNTITDLDVLKNSLQKIKAQGYVIDNEEYIIGLKAVAAPVRNYTGDVVASISIAIPTIRCSTDKKMYELVTEVVKAAQDISKKLGFRSHI